MNIFTKKCLSVLKQNALLIAFGTFGFILLIMFINRLWVPIILTVGIFLFFIVFLNLRKRPEILIVISIVLNYIPKGTRVGYTLLVVTFLYLLTKKLLENKIKYKIDIVKISWLIIIVLGLLTIPMWNNILSGLQWYAALAIVPLLLYILIIDEYISQEAIQWLMRYGLLWIFSFIVAEATVAALIILIKQDTFFSVPNIMTFHGLEIPGNGSNRLAGLLVFISLFGLLSKKLWEGSWLKNTIVYFVLYFSMILTFLMVSRSALVSILSAGIVYIIAKIAYEKKVKIKSIVIAAIVILISAKPFIDHLVFRMKNVSIDASTLSRLMVWKSCIIQIKNGIVLGAGPGQFAFKDIFQLLDDPHNMFLRYGVDFGGVSIIFLMVILAYPLLIFVKKYRSNSADAMRVFLTFAPPLVGTVLHSMIDSTFTSRSTGPLLWLVWAIFVKSLLGHSPRKQFP
jgi:O-antigen ligase